MICLMIGYYTINSKLFFNFQVSHTQSPIYHLFEKFMHLLIHIKFGLHFKVIAYKPVINFLMHV